jgi:hypothetical protein
MSPLEGDQILGGNGEKDREKKQPAIMRVIYEKGNPRTSNEGAQGDDLLFVAKEPMKDEIECTAGSYRQKYL